MKLLAYVNIIAMKYAKYAEQIYGSDMELLRSEVMLLFCEEMIWGPKGLACQGLSITRRGVCGVLGFETAFQGRGEAGLPAL